MFYLDLEGNVNSPEIREALDALPGHAERFKVLGCYPAA
jgi:prephenate dehydratase